MATKEKPVDITELLAEHDNQASSFKQDAARLTGYRDGAPQIAQLGIAIPPQLHRFLTVVNWPGVTVETLVERLTPQAFILPDTTEADTDLWDGWIANDMDSEVPKVFDDALTYGRGFVTVGTNEEDPEHPLITVESPLEMSVVVDPRTRRVTSAVRRYTDDEGVEYATVYLPNETRWLVQDSGDWKDLPGTTPDVHNLGAVPVVPFFNRLKSGRWDGISEMRDVIPITDAAARALTNLQVAQETHAVPSRWAAGLSKGDFVDSKTKEPLPAWQAYFGAVWGTSNHEAKFGQFSASDLRNFHETIKHYGLLVSGLTGINAQMLGFQTDNPASEAGITASDRRLVRKAELRQAVFGDALGRVMALYQRIKSKGSDPLPRGIRTEWVDAATPTKEARAASAVALFTANGISREGLWDEMGWSESRKKREREYFDAQDADPAFARIAGSLEASLGNRGDSAAGVEDVPPGDLGS